MKKRQATNNDDEKLVISVELEEPLRGLVLREMERDDRTAAGMVRVILKRYFAEQMFANSTHQSPKEKIGQLPYYPDELPGAKQGEAD